MGNPYISILVPVYNAGRYLRPAIENVLTQTFIDFELLICDDASTDDSLKNILQFASKDSRIKIIENEQNLGYLKTCNKLFKEAQGKYITFQDADDISMPNRLERIVEYIKRENVEILTSDYHFIDSGGHISKRNEYQIDYKRLRTDIDYKPFLCGQTIVMTKELIAKYGVYDIFFDRLGGEDYEWFFRVACQSKAVCCHIPEILYQYRVHNSAVRQGNINIRKYFILDLVFLIRKTWINDSKYLLSSENRIEMEQIAADYERLYIDNPSEILIYQSQTLVNSKKYWQAIKTALDAIRKQPSYTKSYKNFIYISYSIIRRMF
ncbi:MAG: glycosyltransferase [Bacteroidota bacterium]